jgi:hypothetical protein
MYAKEIIEKYFLHHKDERFDAWYRENAGIFHLHDSIYGIEKLADNTLEVLFENVMKFCDKPIIENGVRIGVVTLAEPHTIFVRKGSCICENVSNYIHKPVEAKGSKKEDIIISKNIFTGRLTVRINNTHIHYSFSCKKITPGSFESKTYDYS